MNNPKRFYAPNGMIYENGQAVGFYDTGDTLGFASDAEIEESKATIADFGGESTQDG
jgi:hypothetical protein